MLILDLGTVIFQPVDGIISWMQGKHLLVSRQTCSACNIPITLSERADISDRFRLVLLHYHALTSGVGTGASGAALAAPLFEDRP